MTDKQIKYFEFFKNKTDNINDEWEYLKEDVEWKSEDEHINLQEDKLNVDEY